MHEKRGTDASCQRPFQLCIMFVDLELQIPEWLAVSCCRYRCDTGSRLFYSPWVSELQNKLLIWAPQWKNVYKLLAQRQVSPTQISLLGCAVCFQPGYVFQWNPRAGCQSGRFLCHQIGSDEQINALCVPRSLLYVTAIILDIQPVGQDPLHGCLSHTCTHLHPHAHVHITYTCAAELALPLVPSLLSGPVEKPHLYDDIQHRIKARVRPSSVYTATAKKGSIQPHTLMQSCTHSGWDTTPRTHTQKKLVCVPVDSHILKCLHALLFSMLSSYCSRPMEMSLLIAVHMQRMQQCKHWILTAFISETGAKPGHPLICVMCAHTHTQFPLPTGTHSHICGTVSTQGRLNTDSLSSRIGEARRGQALS